MRLFRYVRSGVAVDECRAVSPQPCASPSPEDTSGHGSDDGPRPDYKRYFLAGFPCRLFDFYANWTSETKISLAQPNLQINATFTPKLANSAPRNWFIVASPSAETGLGRTAGVCGLSVTIRASNPGVRRAFVDSGRNARNVRAMRPQRITKGLIGTTAAAALALLLAACGPSQPASQGTTEPAPGSATPSTQSAPETSTPSSSSAAPTQPQPASPTATSAAPQSTAAGTQLCKASGLKATTDATGGGAAGSVYMELILTNSGKSACHLKGFAGVSLTTGPNGRPIGAPAQRDTSVAVQDVLLAPGKSGTAVLRYTQAGNYPDCAKTAAAGFRVYPPEDTASLFVARPSDACSNASIELLSIGAFQAR
jgi:hypothetical protein